MRRLFLFGIFALCQATASAAAASICASPKELKALQAAALQQQLAAAAQSCHLTADYGLFVVRYRAAIISSDRTVKTFFKSRTNSEGYDVFKARIAEDASLRSLHDPRFCRSAKLVFDMALGRGGAAKPSLVPTGYEHCRDVSPVVTVYAAHALALAKPTPAPVSVPREVQGIALARVPVPSPRKIAVARVAKATAVVVAVVKKAPEPPKLVEPSLSPAEPPQWRSDPSDEVRQKLDTEERYIPHAYREGAEWVGAELREDDPPPRKHERPLVMGPDGRWYVLIGHQDTWQRD